MLHAILTTLEVIGFVVLGIAVVGIIVLYRAFDNGENPFQ